MLQELEDSIQVATWVASFPGWTRPFSGGSGLGTRLRPEMPYWTCAYHPGAWEHDPEILPRVI